MAAYNINVNGQIHSVDAEPGTPLLWVLRDSLQMLGTKYGCGVGQCGACTVHLEGVAVRSCSLGIDAVADNKIVTIEGLAGTNFNHLRSAWQEIDVAQCGYCQAGQMMTAVALLETNPAPTDEDINTAMRGNLCRCGTYPRIRKAIKAASSRIENRVAARSSDSVAIKHPDHEE